MTPAQPAQPEPISQPPKSWRIELLSDHHDFGGFSCGDEWLDTYLHQHARINQETGYGRTFLALNGAGQVEGFFTLSMASVHFKHLPDDLAKQVPKYPMPVALIGCLAVTKGVQGGGLGTIMLIDAMRRLVQASEIVGVRAVEVLAISDRARNWYLKFGFSAFKDNLRHLYLPMTTVREVVKRSD